MTQNAEVKEVIEGGLCIVSVKRESACGGNCAACGGGCAPESMVDAIAKNSAGAKKGDIVVVESSNEEVYKMAAVVYVLPVLLMIAGYIAGFSIFSLEWAGGVFAIFGFLSGLFAAKKLDSKKRGKILMEAVRVVGKKL